MNQVSVLSLIHIFHLRYDRHVFAGHGGNGSKARSSGKDGEDKYIDVPCGTVVYNAETGEYLCDVTEDGQVVLLLKGDVYKRQVLVSTVPLKSCVRAVSCIVNWSSISLS